MSKRYKADAGTIKGSIEALQAAIDGRLFNGEDGETPLEIEDIQHNACTFGVYIEVPVKKDGCGWFIDHDLWIEPKESDNE